MASRAAEAPGDLGGRADHGVEPETRVNTFTGHLADLDGLGRVCRERGVTFVVNATQALGRRPLDVSELPLDALTCAGYKWLCGPRLSIDVASHPDPEENPPARGAHRRRGRRGAPGREPADRAAP